MIRCTECKLMASAPTHQMSPEIRSGRAVCGTCGAEYTIIITLVQPRKVWRLQGNLVTEQEYKDAHATETHTTETT